MPTNLDFHKATLMAFKNTIEGKSLKEKEQHVSIQVAQQFNGLVDNIRKEHPEAEPHLPKSITMNSIAAQDFQIADIRFLDFEMLVNQVLSTLEVIRGRG